MELQRRHLEMWVALYLMEQYPQLTHAIHRAVVQRDPEVLPDWNAVVDEFAEKAQALGVEIAGGVE